MFRNYLAAALRNLVRSKLYAAINIIGLAVGFTAALLIALFVRSELSYDRWIPGYRDAYHITTAVMMQTGQILRQERAPPNFAALLKEQVPSIETVARITNFSPVAGAVRPILRRGETEATENLFWADPEFFTVVPLPVIAGDLKAALVNPNGIVLTRELARKYFGTNAPVGQTIEIDRQHPMTVTAVVEDLPAESHFTFTAIASGRAPFSPLAAFETPSGAAQARNYEAAFTYFRVAKGADVEAVRAQLPALAARPEIRRDEPFQRSYQVIPLDEIHLGPNAIDAMKPAGNSSAVYTMCIVGLMILAVASINFVNLMAVRGARRAVEIGIRKVSGAERRDLIVQFLGEAMVYAVFGAVLALGLAAALLPEFNAFLGGSIAMGFTQDFTLPAVFAALVLAVGIGAGIYPAFILSAFHPAATLWVGKQQKRGRGRGQYTLVAFQFAVLLGLMVACGVIWQQTVYATTEGTRLDADAMLVIDGGACSEAFQNEVRGLAGVRGAACSMGAPLVRFSGVVAQRGDGQKVLMGYEPVAFGLLELYGLQPVAGRLFSRDRGADAFPLVRDPAFVPQIVLNETAVRALGFSSPAAAIGQGVSGVRSELPAQIIGVVPDFPFGSLKEVIPPVSFAVEPAVLQREQTKLHIKLSGREVPETLAAIDRIWRTAGAPRPIIRSFVDERVQRIYADVTRQGQMFGVFTATALFIACLGLFGLAAFAAERRTKEIGIRKAMGASRVDILKVMIWDFTKPVLWANLIAWPAGYFLMRRWLEGFAYHIDIQPWIFIAASTLALLIAVATVFGHALLVSRAQPVSALRYE